MKYVIIGAGGTGGMLGAYLAGAGQDVTLIARGKHLEQIQKNGLTIKRLWNQTNENIRINALDMDSYRECPDVIFVCVKSYSLDSTIPFIKRVSKNDTIVIPILNVYGTGEKLQESLPDLLVTDGCIYVSAFISEPGVISQHSSILRVVYGVRKIEHYRPKLAEILGDLNRSGIDGILSTQIQKECLKKFSYVSPVGAASLYFNATAGEFSKEGAPREFLKELMHEVMALGEAMGIVFDYDLPADNLRILSGLPDDATTSMQRDIMEKKQSEADGLIYEVVRLGDRFNVPVPAYRKVAEKISEYYI